MYCKVHWIDDVRGARIGIMPRPRGGEWLESEIKSLSAQGVQVVVSLLTQDEVDELELSKECDLCHQNKIEFLRFPILDREVPQLDRDLADFVQSLKDRLTGGEAIAIHCRAGIGRSAIIAASLLVSSTQSVDEVMSKISKSRGFPVPDTYEQLEWVRKFAAWRKEDTQ